MLQKFTVSCIQLNKDEDVHTLFLTHFCPQYLQAAITFLLLPYCQHSDAAEYPYPGNKENF